MEIFQSQPVAMIWANNPKLFGHAMLVVMPTARDNGSQNTEKPYAIPMHRWMASAAGGTSQRLKPGPAMMRSLLKNPGATCPASTADIRGSSVLERLRGAENLKSANSRKLRLRHTSHSRDSSQHNSYNGGSVQSR